jgi:hypothetical protein
MRFTCKVFSSILLCCLNLAAYQCFAQDNQSINSEVKKLHFKSGPHQTFDTTPNVRVWSFICDYMSEHGIELTLTGVKNWTSKPATAVKISWYLTRNENYHDVIRTGQTKLIELGTLPPGEDVSNLKISVVTSKDVLKSLKGKIPEGDLYVGIEVSEVHFADGSIWKEKEE